MRSARKPGSSVVVTGATGAIGRIVTSRLVRNGWQVSGVTQHPSSARLPAGVSAVYGDLSDPSTLDQAFAGAGQIVLIAFPSTVHEVLAQARRAGVNYVVVISSGAVTAGYDTTYNAVVERAVIESDLEWAIVRPGEFATNGLLIWGPSVRAERRVVEPFPDQVGQPIHEADVADVVVADLLDPQRRGRIDTIVGPDRLTKREQVAAISTAIGAEIRLDQVTAAEARAFYQAQGGFAAANADFLFGFETYDGVQGEHDEPAESGEAEPEYPDLSLVTGQPARSYQQWAHDHATDFAGPRP
jgi:uncharacterized protein YbjT (DUF2867 family)